MLSAKPHAVGVWWAFSAELPSHLVSLAMPLPQSVDVWLTPQQSCFVSAFCCLTVSTIPIVHVPRQEGSINFTTVDLHSHWGRAEGAPEYRTWALVHLEGYHRHLPWGTVDHLGQILQDPIGVSHGIWLQLDGQHTHPRTKHSARDALLATAYWERLYQGSI